MGDISCHYCLALSVTTAKPHNEHRSGEVLFYFEKGNFAGSAEANALYSILSRGRF